MAIFYICDLKSEYSFFKRENDNIFLIVNPIKGEEYRCESGIECF